MTDTELLTRLRAIEQRRRGDYAQQLTILSELDGRAADVRLGYRDVAALARDVLRLNPKQARRRAAHADAIIAAHTSVGEPLEPELPETGRACAEGAIGQEHVQAITDTIAKMPRPHDLEDVALADKVLSEAARDNEPSVIVRLGREILARLDQDGKPPSEEELVRPPRHLDLRELRGGRMRLAGELDPETGALLSDLLSPHTAPRTSEESDLPDLRSKAQRQGDAFAEILRLAATNPDGPVEAGEPVNLMVSVSLEQLAAELGDALLHGVGDLAIAHVRRMACDCNVIPAVLGTGGEVLDIGRKSRIVPLALRRALIHRDRGCAFPGCPKKPKWCHAHHLRHWANGGVTAIHNTVLLCHHHHRVIHHTGWQVRMRDGLPEFIPPPHVDPQQVPRRNILHHRE